MIGILIFHSIKSLVIVINMYILYSIDMRTIACTWNTYSLRNDLMQLSVMKLHFLLQQNLQQINNI